MKQTKQERVDQITFIGFRSFGRSYKAGHLCISITHLEQYSQKRRDALIDHFKKQLKNLGYVCVMKPKYYLRDNESRRAIGHMYDVPYSPLERSKDFELGVYRHTEEEAVEAYRYGGHSAPVEVVKIYV